MKILVIGGTRFIGAALVAHLHAQGHETAVFNRGQSPLDPPEGVRRITGDLENLAEYRSEFADFGPEVVLHNVVLHERHIGDLQSAFRGIARRLVMTSSMDVYLMFGRINGSDPGEPAAFPVDEEGPLRQSRYPYRAQFPDENHRMHHYDKIPAEEAVLSDPDLPGTVLRLPMVIGPHDYQNRLLRLVKPMHDQRPAIVLHDLYAQWRSTYGYIDNVAAAMALACTDDRAAGRIYNIGEFTPPMLEIAQQVKAVMDWPGEFVVLPGEKLPESLRFGVAQPHQNLVCDTRRIASELGFRPEISFEESIRRTTIWTRDSLPETMPEGMLNYEAEDEVLAALKNG